MEQAILGVNKPEYHYPRVNGRQKEETLSHKDFYILTLHLAGKTAEEIAELAGYSSPLSIYQVLRKEKVIRARQQLLEAYELEFESVQREVFNEVVNLIRSEDPKVKLEAINIWMKKHGKFQPKVVNDTQLTAEDVISKMLQVNVQVNVGGEGVGDLHD